MRLFVMFIAAFSVASCDLVIGTPIEWSDSAAAVCDGPTGTTCVLDLPGGGTEGSLWGSLYYTDDSSVGTAAVHAGAIDFAFGGTVTIRIEDGQAAYVGTEANGVTSSDWGSWPRSFVVVN